MISYSTFIIQSCKYVVEMKCTILMNPHYWESLEINVALVTSLCNKKPKSESPIALLTFLRVAIYKYVSQFICISFRIIYVNLISISNGGANYALPFALSHLKLLRPCELSLQSKVHNLTTNKKCAKQTLGRLKW